MTEVLQSASPKPFYKKVWVWGVGVLATLFLAVAAVVMLLAASFTSALQIDTGSDVNRGYVERALADVFDGRLVGVDFLAYGETKSAFNSDLSAVALIAAADMEGLAEAPPQGQEAALLAQVAKEYPHLNLSPEAAVVGRAEAYSGRDRLTLFRLQDGTGLLQLQSF